MWLKLFIFTRHFAAPLKENKTLFVKKNREFVGSEFAKICHEQVTCQTFSRLSGLAKLPLAKLNLKFDTNSPLIFKIQSKRCQKDIEKTSTFDDFSFCF